MPAESGATRSSTRWPLRTSFRGPWIDLQKYRTCRVGKAKRADVFSADRTRGHGACAPLPTLRSLLVSMVLALFASAALAADTNLYQATTFVTGQYEPNRSIGFGKCLEYVLVKVTGDPRLTGDPRVVAMAGKAKSYVTDFHYRDLMEGIPVHDE